MRATLCAVLREHCAATSPGSDCWRFSTRARSIENCSSQGKIPVQCLSRASIRERGQLPQAGGQLALVEFSLRACPQGFHLQLGASQEIVADAGRVPPAVPLPEEDRRGGDGDDQAAELGDVVDKVSADPGIVAMEIGDRAGVVGILGRAADQRLVQRRHSRPPRKIALAEHLEQFADNDFGDVGVGDHRARVPTVCSGRSGTAGAAL